MSAGGTLLWAILGGGVGSGARYLVGVWVLQRFGAAFPFGTLIVNLAGCFAIGVLAHVAAAQSWTPEARSAVFAGVLGGFTTYSGFNHETLMLMTHGSAVSAIANIGVMVVGGLAAGWLGLVAARQLVA